MTSTDHLTEPVASALVVGDIFTAAQWRAGVPGENQDAMFHVAYTVARFAESYPQIVMDSDFLTAALITHWRPVIHNETTPGDGVTWILFAHRHFPDLWFFLRGPRQRLLPNRTLNHALAGPYSGPYSIEDDVMVGQSHMTAGPIDHVVNFVLTAHRQSNEVWDLDDLSNLLGRVPGDRAAGERLMLALRR